MVVGPVRGRVVRSNRTAGGHGWQIADGVADREETGRRFRGDRSVGHEIADTPMTVGRRGEAAVAAEIPPPPHEENAPTHLRHAILRGEEFREFDVVSGRLECVADFPEDGAARQRGETGDVLDEQYLGPEFLGDADEVMQQAVPGIE